MLLRSLWHIGFLVSIISLVLAQAPWPGAVPLAIRSPHFNAWLPSPGRQNWPTFWNDRNRTLSLLGFIRIDNVKWEWLGSPGLAGESANLTDTEVTAGPMEFEVTFLSPIEPTDLVRQSFPFIYMYLTAKATDEVTQFRFTIFLEWASGDNGNEVAWSTTPGDDFVFHQVQRASPNSMQEINDQAEDTTIYYAMANNPNATWQTGGFTTLRNQFKDNVTGGRLLNTEDKDFQVISNNRPVFAHSMDLGSISEISTPVVWALGLVRDPTIRYAVGDGSIQLRSSYFWTQYKTIGDAIGAFIKDFPDARQRAIDLDQKITSDALSISQDYADLVSLSARQTMSGIDITISNGTDGQWNTSGITTFMKSVGDTSRRVNPTEFMFAAFPAHLYLNASWAGLLLKSSLQQQAATIPASIYAIPNLGSTYSSALGNASIANTEPMAIESSGDMIIMALAHAQSSGDGTLLSRYYSLLKNWANYLAVNSLNQTMFISSDGQNNPNLAIKGIIGIRAMGEISQILNFFNQTIYDDQTTFYAAKIPTAGTYGIPYDSNLVNQVKSHWTMLTAATTTNSSTRDHLVSMVRLRAWLNSSQLEFPTDYDAISGAASGMGGRSSPAQGAMFAFLALNLPDQNITASVPGDGDGNGNGGNSKPNPGIIVGIILAAIVAIGLVGFCLLRWKRYGKRQGLTPASSLSPFSLHRAHGDVEGTSGLHPWDNGQHVPPPALMLSTSSSLNRIPQQSGLHQHSNSHNTSSGPFSPDKLSTSSTTSTSERSPDGRPVLDDSKVRMLAPLPLNLVAPPSFIALVPPHGGVSPQVDVPLNIRGELEIIRQEVAEIRAQRMYDINELPPRYD
ncbi:hypothetical protein BD779DRAFT_1673561 [Infundibulicybe gibba]|nr:hypothetical protein BD779DRAFT_1673561 [Infundibulicybe gibba]